MKLHLLPNTMGLLWFKQAYAIFKTLPKAYLMLFAACYILAVLAFMGSIALAAIGILCSITMMIATNELKHGRINSQSPIVLDIFSTVLRQKNIVILILLYTLCFFLMHSLVGFLCIHLAPDFYAKNLEYTAILKSPDHTPPEMLLRAYPNIILMQAILLITPYLLLFPLFCMTPALILWSSTPPLKAIIFNLIALIKDRTTWLIFILCWTCITIIVILFAGLVFAFSSFLLGKAGIALDTILTLIFVILFCAIGSAIMSAALYFAHQNCFIMQSP